MNRLIKLGFMAGVELFGGYFYCQWLLASAVHKYALERFGLMGYWFCLGVPVLLMSPLFALIGVPGSRLPKWAIVLASIVAATVIAYFGLFGKWLICVFVTRVFAIDGSSGRGWASRYTEWWAA